jgi:hypothetical protein
MSDVPIDLPEKTTSWQAKIGEGFFIGAAAASQDGLSRRWVY